MEVSLTVATTSGTCERASNCAELSRSVAVTTGDEVSVRLVTYQAPPARASNTIIMITIFLFIKVLYQEIVSGAKNEAKKRSAKRFYFLPPFLAAFAASISALIASRFAVFFDREVLFFPTPVSRFAIMGGIIPNETIITIPYLGTQARDD